MIKTVVTPENNILYLTIPNKYVGKEVEVLLYSKDEVIQEKANSKKIMADFSGILSDNDYQSLKTQTEQARKEWSRDI